VRFVSGSFCNPNRKEATSAGCHDFKLGVRGTGVRFLAGKRDLSLVINPQIGSGKHQTSYAVTTVGGITSFSVEVKNEWRYSFTPACTEKFLLMQREFK
jgi:hypothetical protein